MIKYLSRFKIYRTMVFYIYLICVHIISIYECFEGFKEDLIYKTRKINKELKKIKKIMSEYDWNNK